VPPGPSRPRQSRLFMPDMLPRPRTLPAGFIQPCLPMKAPEPPFGALWLHEIKHDGFRIIARKDGPRVKLYSRPGNDLTDRFSLIVEALAGLRSRSCIIDGEAVACDDRGIAAFDRIRYRWNDDCVFLYAFDLIELNGDDLRRSARGSQGDARVGPGQGPRGHPVQRASGIR
jgi:bifunctional non-homologous end joining protein LigD